MDIEKKGDLLQALCDECAQCEDCPNLATPSGRERKNVVFGDGNPGAKLVIVGEAPGEEEDAQGVPFVGPAGNIFEAHLAAMNSSRDEVFIVNTVMCRPTLDGAPGKNRKPTAQEVGNCQKWLHQIIEIVDPYVVLVLGDTAMRALVPDSSAKILATTRKAGKHSAERFVAVTKGLMVPVPRACFAGLHPAYFTRPENYKEEEGSDLHKSLLTWNFAFRVMDEFNRIYHGTTPPRRFVDG